MKYEYTVTERPMGGAVFLSHTAQMDLDGWEMVSASAGGKYPDRLLMVWKKKVGLSDGL